VKKVGLKRWPRQGRGPWAQPETLERLIDLTPQGLEWIPRPATDDGRGRLFLDRKLGRLCHDISPSSDL
jgi:hypothetical protein